MPGQNDFRPLPGRFGTHPIVYGSGPIGGADYLGGASPLTADATTIFRLGAVAAKSMFSRLAASCLQVPVDADGTMLAYVYKYDASANAAVQLSEALSLEGLTSREGGFATWLSTLGTEDLILDEGDTIEVHVVSNSAAIDTQPTRLVFNVEVLVLR